MMRFQPWCFQLKNDPPVFWKRFSFWKKICFQGKVLKLAEFPLIVSKKHADFSNGGLFWIFLVTCFKRTYALSIGFKVKPRFPMLRQKPISKFAVKLAERSNHSFLLSIWWITFFRHLYSLICDNGMYGT